MVRARIHPVCSSNTYLQVKSWRSHTRTVLSLEPEKAKCPATARQRIFFLCPDNSLRAMSDTLSRSYTLTCLPHATTTYALLAATACDASTSPILRTSLSMLAGFSMSHTLTVLSMDAEKSRWRSSSTKRHVTSSRCALIVATLSRWVSSYTLIVLSAADEKRCVLLTASEVTMSLWSLSSLTQPKSPRSPRSCVLLLSTVDANRPSVTRDGPIPAPRASMDMSSGSASTAQKELHVCDASAFAAAASSGNCLLRLSRTNISTESYTPGLPGTARMLPTTCDRCEVAYTK
mmetsp:Transcript_12408/g.39247  ORF Transcript_12408/g.39247 Transcript_12408/m.39247 type:complete len:290 (-) Transcript_12408:875-1744(-)